VYPAKNNLSVGREGAVPELIRGRGSRRVGESGSKLRNSDLGQTKLIYPKIQNPGKKLSAELLFEKPPL
jgi:hypothetical protein